MDIWRKRVAALFLKVYGEDYTWKESRKAEETVRKYRERGGGD